MGCYWPDVTNVYFAGPIAIQATTVSVVSVLVKTTSQPSLVLFSVPTPRTFWPGTPETGVNETIACSLNGFGKVKCFVVGILALGVIFILPACIIKPPKAEFCTQKEGELYGNQGKTGDGLIFIQKIMKARNLHVTEWEVFGVIVALVAFAISIGTPIVKLNTSITRLIDRLNMLDEGMDELTARNSKSHERLWKHNEEQVDKLHDHETRITILEKKER